MANYPEIAVPLAQRDYAAMFDNTVIIAERLPLVEQDAFINNVTTAYRLMNLEPVAISPSRDSFLFRGQNSRNQIIAGPEGQVNSSTFLATSRQPEGATMYSRDNTDTLAVFLSPDRTIEGIPLPNNLAEIGYPDRASANSRGLTYYPPERNIGGYATRNDEIVLQPSQTIQVDPRSIDIQGTRYRPVVISNEPVAPREWSSIEGSLRERIGG